MFRYEMNLRANFARMYIRAIMRACPNTDFGVK